MERKLKGKYKQLLTKLKEQKLILTSNIYMEVMK